MQINPDLIQIEPGYETRNWQSCDYYYPAPDGGRIALFHERTYVRTRPQGRRGKEMTPAEAMWLIGGAGLGVKTVQWFHFSLTESEAQSLCARHPGSGYLEEFYPEDPDKPTYFLRFRDTELALSFCKTPDFDRYCLTLDKME